MSIGITGRLGFKEHYFANLSYSEVVSSDVAKFKINPIVFQCGLEFYIPCKTKDDKTSEE